MVSLEYWIIRTGLGFEGIEFIKHGLLKFHKYIHRVERTVTAR